jgi:type II secretory pathway pseudopilin PulG
MSVVRLSHEAGLTRCISPHPSSRTPHASAFTIVEAVIASVIVGVMLVAALNTVGASRLTQHKAALTSQGRLLAETLMAEILVQDYRDPDGTPVFGGEAGEATTTRADFDDVDDYHEWVASPPTTKDGTPLANTTGWTRTVTVQWIDPLDPAQVEDVETNAKRVTVTGSYGDVPQVTLVAIKTARQ